jgi:hypothetical protein
MRSTGARTLSIAVLMAVISLFVIAASAAAAAKPIAGGELDWGVKESFREYIHFGAQEGQIDIAGGAAEAEDGTYRFPVVSGSYEAPGEEAEVQFRGSVRFSAYYAFGGGTPLLDITIKNPKVVFEGDEGAVYADVAYREGATLVEESDLDLAELDATGIVPVEAGEAVTWSGAPSFLTADGEPVFGSYPAGEEFDPVTVVASYVPTLFGHEEATPPPAGEVKPGDETKPAPPASTVPATPAPVVPMPTLKSLGGGAKLGEGGSATVAMVTCPSGGACTLVTPRTVKVKIGGKTYVAKVIAPHRVLAGQSAKVTVKLPAAALAELAGGKVKISLKLVLGSGSLVQTKFVRATLKTKGELR